MFSCVNFVSSFRTAFLWSTFGRLFLSCVHVRLFSWKVTFLVVYGEINIINCSVGKSMEKLTLPVGKVMLIIYVYQLPWRNKMSLHRIFFNKMYSYFYDCLVLKLSNLVLSITFFITFTDYKSKKRMFEIKICGKYYYIGFGKNWSDRARWTNN